MTPRVRGGRALGLGAGALVLAAAAVLTVGAMRAWLGSGPPDPGRQDLDAFELVHEPSEVPAGIGAELPFVLGDRLHLDPGEPQRLARPLRATLLGRDAALAVPSRDRRHLAYHAWSDGTPLLVVRELRTGRERVLARGAQSVAWGPNGQLAYFQALDAHGPQDAYVGHVMVRNSVEEPPTRWTASPDTYEVRAWARERLLVAVRPCPRCFEGLEPGLYALARPGAIEALPLADLSALSPDGRWAVGLHDESPGRDAPPPVVRLVELEPLRVAATLDLQGALRSAGTAVPRPDGGVFAGSWRGDEIVLGSPLPGESSLVFLRVEEERLDVDGVLRIPRDAFGAPSGVSFGRPSFAGTGTDRVVVPVAWQPEEAERSASVLVCDRGVHSCAAGEPRPSTRSFALVESPSRP